MLKHIAFIMDGNGRWAASRGKKRSDGHKIGAQTMQDIVNACFDKGIKFVTVYALSTENFRNRPKDELDGLFDLVRSHLNSSSSHFKRLLKRNIKVEFVGDLTVFDSDILETIASVRKQTANCSSGQLNIAINYGARDEIAMAINLCVDARQKVTTDSIASLLYTKGSPDPDLIVRTGGDMRLSNFLLYQAAYSELFFSPTLWPDFGEQELDAIIADYNLRKRKFGGI